jgi:hypothetical protein
MSTVRNFQPALPTLEVEVLDQDDLKRLREDMSRNPSVYVKTARLGVQNLRLNKHGLWEPDAQWDDYINGYPRVYVARAGSVLVTSQNGRKYVGDDTGISNGHFDDVPIELFHPVNFIPEDNYGWDD